MSSSVTILGAGMVGICCALSLAERGVSVRLIDRGDPGQETSYGNAGVISPWSIIPQATPGIWKALPKLLFGHNRPLAVRPSFWPRMVPWGLRFLRHGNETQMRAVAAAMEVMCAPSIDLYRRHLKGTGHEDLVRDSAYVHAFRQADRASLKSLEYAVRIERGANLELVGADELHRLEPALSRDFQAAILIHDQARTISPGTVGQVLAEKATSLGVEILRAEINDLHRADGKWQINCGGQTIRTERVVVAMGAWSTELLKPLGLKVPLVAERGYHVEFENPEIELNNSIMDVDAKFVASSMMNGLRAAGHAEFGTVDAPPDPRRQKRLERQARAAFPDLPPKASRTWLGRRPSFPDSLPMVGEFDTHPGLFAAFGHSHYGLMMAPKTGEVIAQILTDESLNADLSPFSTSRFTHA